MFALSLSLATIVAQVILATFVAARAWNHRPARLLVYTSIARVVLIVSTLIGSQLSSVKYAYPLFTVFVISFAFYLFGLTLLFSSLFAENWWQGAKPIRYISLPFVIAIVVLTIDLVAQVEWITYRVVPPTTTRILDITTFGTVFIFGSLSVISLLHLGILGNGFVRYAHTRRVSGLLFVSIIASVVVSQITISQVSQLSDRRELNSDIRLTSLLEGLPILAVLGYAVVGTRLIVPMRAALDTAMETTSDAVAVLDQSGGVIYANTQAELLGVQLNSTLFHVAGNDNTTNDVIQSLFHTAVAVERPTQQLVTLGDQRRVHLTLSPLLNQHQQQRGVLLLGRDITELEQRNALLEREQTRLRLITDQTPAMVWTTDNTLCLTSMQGAALEQLFGSNQSAIGKPISELTVFPVPVREVLTNIHTHAVGGSSATQEVEFEHHSYYCHVEPLRDPDGGIIGAIGVALDITSQKREAQLRLAQQTAEAANQAKSTFLAHMSHELRTPLNAILGFTQLLHRDASLGVEQRKTLGIVTHSGEHLLSLINDVLEMSKIESGRVDIQLNDTDLFQLLTRLQEMFSLRAEQKGLWLKFDHAPTIPRYIRTDARKLHQILINLLGNALKFTQTGTVSLSVDTCSRATSDDCQNCGPDSTCLRFTIRDTGPGIALTDREHIFDAFVQTAEGNYVQQGTGLGLTISQQFVELLGGHIAVDSIPGEGSTFVFTIPVKQGEATPTAEPQPQRVLDSSRDEAAPEILIVEDSSELAKLSSANQAALHRAVVALDLVATRSIIATIGEQKPVLATTLTALVDDFRFDVLQSLLDRAINSSHSEVAP